MSQVIICISLLLLAVCSAFKSNIAKYRKDFKKASFYAFLVYASMFFIGMMIAPVVIQIYSLL
ncbi:MAG: hypothetical protein NTZ13_01600 [Candidatus Parcubacteria bacterium]|nr:hypothetical protein [Candidatus Parcubacteria bacterium]